MLVGGEGPGDLDSIEAARVIGVLGQRRRDGVVGSIRPNHLPVDLGKDPPDEFMNRG
jgi:hypothetical protein